MAKEFDWKPSGAVPDPVAARNMPDYPRFFKSDYDPDEWAYCKRVTDDDAANLSQALRRAAASIHAGNVTVLEQPGPTLLRDDISAEELKRVNQLPSELLDKFADFAAGGGFAFAWDD
jgi:hypothetical protein